MRLPLLRSQSGVWSLIDPFLVSRSKVLLVVASAERFLATIFEAIALALITAAAGSMAGVVLPRRFDGFSAREIALLALVLLLMKLLLNVAAAHQVSSVAAQVLESARVRFVAAYFSATGDRRSSLKLGDLQQAAGTHADQIAGNVLSLANYIGGLLALLAYFCVSMALNPLVTIGSVVTGSFVILFLRPLTHRIRNTSEAYVFESKEFAVGLTELALAAREIATFGVGPSVVAQESGHIGISASSFRASRFGVMLAPVVFQTAVLVLAAGGLSIFASSSSASTLLSAGVTALILFRMLSASQQTITSLHRIRLDMPNAALFLRDVSYLEHGPLATGSTVPQRVGSISLNQVGYEYSRGELVLRDIDFTIRADEALGIIGPSGSGKSTLLDLILRYSRPTQGAVTLGGGIDVWDVSYDWWASRVAFVAQSPVMIPGTVAENVRFFRDIPSSRVEWALGAAGLSSELDRHRKGSMSEVQSRSGLSGGQLQRLALARALAGRPEVLVLDEPSSALDPRSERNLQETLMALKGEMTIVIVSHRLASLDFCDRVVALVDGRVIAEGSTADVLAESDALFGVEGLPEQDSV